MPCSEEMSGRFWLSLSGKSDLVLRRARERESFLQRTRRPVVEKSRTRAMLRNLIKSRALPLPGVCKPLFIDNDMQPAAGRASTDTDEDG